MTIKNIPVQNLYYLLAYAWDHFREGDEIDVAAESCPDIHNLLARVLANGITRLASRGMDKGFLPYSEETPRLRGKVLVVESYRHRTHIAGKMLCEYDELSADTIPNRILRETCYRLLNSDLLTAEIRGEVHKSQRLLRDISSISLTRRVFSQFQLHRNNRHYRFLLHVCRLLHDSYLPEESSGRHRFRDILKQEITMHRVFERFVLNFAQRHCRDASVRAMPIRWSGEWDKDVEDVLPTMRTDVTIEYPERKTILECKYYPEAFVSRHGRQRLHSNHLYQLNAYLQNQSLIEGWKDVDGVLLYPAVDHRLNHSFTLLGHTIRICSIDLDQPWSKIELNLLEMLQLQKH